MNHDSGKCHCFSGVHLLTTGTLCCTIPPLVEWLLQKVLRLVGTRRLCRQHLSEHAVRRSMHGCQRCGTTKQVNHAQQAKAGSCAGRTNRAREEKNLLVASSDESEARHATSARSCSSAHSCRRTHSFDQGRSDLWSLYHEGSHSRFAGVPLQPAQTATRMTGAGDCAVA